RHGDEAKQDQRRPGRRDSRRGKQQRSQPARGEQGAKTLAAVHVQLARPPSVLDDQLRPRDRATVDLGVEQIGQVPDLEVGRQQRRLEVDAKPALPQAQSELDVLYRRMRIPGGIESADVCESLARYRPAPGPECVDVASGADMVVAVDKILVLREEIR